MNEEHESMSPLQLAASEGKLSQVQWLVEMGENVDAMDYLGRTALVLAIINHQYYVAVFLITVGANVNLADSNGITPLHHVCNHSLTLTKSLVAHGAVISQRGGPLGLTPLHIAAHSCNLDVVRFLLKQGADVTIETTRGDRPIDMNDDEAITKAIHRAEMFVKKINRKQHANRILLYGGLGFDENTKPISQSPPPANAQLRAPSSRTIITFQSIATVWRYDPSKEPDCSLVGTEAINLKKRKWYQTFSTDT